MATVVNGSREGIVCDFVRKDYRNNGWGGSDPIKGCSLKATRAFEEAPYGTARSLRTTVHLCTRHFNAEMQGQNDWGVTPIRTSEYYRI